MDIVQKHSISEYNIYILVTIMSLAIRNISVFMLISKYTFHIEYVTY
jgi:hypothetical protein